MPSVGPSGAVYKLSRYERIISIVGHPHQRRSDFLALNGPLGFEQPLPTVRTLADTGHSLGYLRGRRQANAREQQ